MYHITLSEEIKRLCPAFQGVAVMAQVTNSAHNAELWREIDAFTRELRAGETAESIKQQPAIAATREAYKRCGKDPSRYRPSAEALRRRLMRGLELYQIDTLVDLINLVSLRTGYSIGGFDADKIQGDSLELGIGRAEEPFEGIGRGTLNIEGLPVYRDRAGGHSHQRQRTYQNGTRNPAYPCHCQRIQRTRRAGGSRRNDTGTPAEIRRLRRRNNTLF